MQEELTDITPQPGDFAVVRVQGIVGRLIRFGQWLNGDGFKDFEHAFIYLGDDEILEAEPGGARITSVNWYQGRKIDWSTGKIHLTPEQRAVIVEAAKQMQGVPYSFLDYLLIALKRIHVTVPLLTKRVVASKHQICSQLVATIYNIADNPLATTPPYLVTPADLANLLEK